MDKKKNLFGTRSVLVGTTLGEKKTKPTKQLERNRTHAKLQTQKYYKNAPGKTYTNAAAKN